VAKSSSGKRVQFWRTDWFVGVLVVIGVVILHQVTDFTGTLERRFYDFASTSTSRQPSDRIAVIAIDDQSIANIGRWPWSRDVHAEMTDKLAAAKAKTVVNTVFFFEPQTDRGLVFIRKMKEALAPSVGQGGLGDQLNKVIEEAEAALDTDAKLAASMQKAGNVLIPSVFELGEPLGKPDNPLPPYALKSAVDESQGFSLPAIKGQQPLQILGDAAAGIGHLNQSNDVDGAVRTEPLLVNYYGKAVPSMALLAAANSLNLGPADIKLNVGDSVQIGKLKVKTDDYARMLPQFYKGKDGKPAFAVDSFYDVLTGKIPASKYTDKIVLIGATANGVGTKFATPVDPSLSPAEMMAHITSSILSEHFIVQPGWSTWASLGLFLLIAGYLIAILPRLTAGTGAIITLAGFVLLLGSEFFLLSRSALWLTLVFPATLLAIGHLALTTKRFLVTEAGKLKSDEESAETNRMMGLALQGQGQLDMSFDRFRRVPMSDAVMDNLYNLALDFERKRQFNKAQAVYEHMATYRVDFKDLQSKLNRAKNLSETVILGGGGAHPGGTMLLDGGAVEKPMLGRYQVEKELGKGAMGVVYLGKDPKIGRVVAIKTMALSQEFEGEELDDARERFFREAETAGRLQHQNIVTIFDAGEEHDLAYIAMEFLKGKDLVDFCKGDAASAGANRAVHRSPRGRGLVYAHAQSVVHRDIKPANIMYEASSDTVKVTDFGIARITDSSKTKTGLVLGTPSFMSPEQLAGKKVDGRSDLYSLGVMLFQMLTGVLPFRGDSMAELMYKIANEPAPDIRIIRKELPDAVAELVAFSVRKRPEDRYQDGAKFAQDLRKVMAGGSLSDVAVVDIASPAPVSGVVAAPSDAATAGAEKTQVFSAAPAESEKTQVMSTPVEEKTQVFAAPVADPAPVSAPYTPERTVPLQAPASYDATQKMDSIDTDQFAKTAVISHPTPATPDEGGAGGTKT
jgi:serine/threonine protein kinase/CHASE2 domain-containing sensor protein